MQRFFSSRVLQNHKIFTPFHILFFTLTVVIRNEEKIVNTNQLCMGVMKFFYDKNNIKMSKINFSFYSYNRLHRKLPPK